MLRNHAYIFVAIIMIGGCRPVPFKVQALSISEMTKVEQTASKHSDLDLLLAKGMKARYEKAKRPSFGLINGFYRLPATKPFGAASVIRSYSYNTYFESIEIADKERAYAIEPIAGDDAITLNQAINTLLDSGVKIKDISMTDALAIAKAESEAAKGGKVFMGSTVFPPDVDYLMSIYPAQSARGHVLIGRVIKKDGSLLAFRMLYQGAHNPVGELVITLFEDTINRI